MNPLSTFKYIKSNFSRTLPILISMIVGVLLIYIFSLLTQSSSEMIDITWTNINKKYASVFSTNTEPIPQNLIDRINSDSNVSYVLPYQEVNGSLGYESVFGSAGIDNFSLYGEDIPKLLKSLDIKLVQGVLPKKNAREIILHKRFALENKLKVGDYIGSEISSIYQLGGKYKISGIMDGPVMIAVVNENEKNISRDVMLKHAMLIRIKDIKNKDLISYLAKNAPKNVLVTDYYSKNEQMNDVTKVLNSLVLSLTICIILVICISLGNLNYISFLNRKYEFGVLSAIGYKKSSLYFKLWKENASVCLLGYVAGIIVSIIIAFILNITIFEPNGKLIPLWNVSGALSAFCVPLFVSFLSLIAPVKELKRTDPMEVIGGGI